MMKYYRVCISIKRENAHKVIKPIPGKHSINVNFIIIVRYSEGRESQILHMVFEMVLKNAFIHSSFILFDICVIVLEINNLSNWWTKWTESQKEGRAVKGQTRVKDIIEAVKAKLGIMIYMRRSPWMECIREKDNLQKNNGQVYYFVMFCNHLIYMYTLLGPVSFLVLSCDI